MTEYKTMTDEEWQIVDDLHESGMDQVCAEVYVTIALNRARTSGEVQRYTTLQQPQVSTALKALEASGYVVEASAIKRKGRGRPTKAYTIGIVMNDVVMFYGELAKANFELILERLNACSLRYSLLLEA